MLVEKPNILIIHADQHRWDCINVYGNKDIKTPNLNALATDGIIFTNCFSTFPLCTPARYSFLTGLYAHQHLGWTNRSTIPHRLDTFPKILKSLGYITKCVGKMHFTPTYLDVGFDEMILSEQDGPGRYDDDYHKFLKDNDIADLIDMQDQIFEYRTKAPKKYFETFGVDQTNLDEEYYSTTWIANRACEVIENWSENGNLLMIGFIKPHHPHDVPEKWSKLYDPQQISLLPGWTNQCLNQDLEFRRGFFDNSQLNEEKMKVILSKYYGAISQIDFQIGKIIEILRRKGLYNNTLIIYTSDHGDFMGYHHMVLKGNYMYDPVIKVPLIVKFPNSFGMNIKDSKVSDNLTSILDISATIITNAGTVIPKHLWNNIYPLEEIIEDNPRKIVFAENEQHYMIRTKNRKLLLCQDENMNQFFDLEKDPYELYNLFKDPKYQNEIDKLKKEFYNWIAFSSKTKFHVDPSAPTIITKSKESSQTLKEYFYKKMELWRKSQNK